MQKRKWEKVKISEEWSERPEQCTKGKNTPKMLNPSAVVQLTNGSCTTLLSSFRLELNEERMPTGENKTKKTKNKVEDTPQASGELI